MPAVRRLAALTDLLGEHEGFLVDLWGVVHDGEKLGEGVREMVLALAAQGARICFLSNTSRLGSDVAAQLVTMGLPRDSFLDAVSSGDVTRAAVLARDPAIFAGCPPAPRVLHVGDLAYVPWLEETGLTLVEDVARADLVIATGSSTDAARLAATRARLAPLAARGVPLVCTNPDRVIPAAHGLKIGPGAIAQAYAELGGPTFLFGKPHAPIYRAALERLACTPERIVAVGDMLETDIEGARRAGLTSVLVTTGVHREVLGASPTDAALEALFTAEGVRPDAVIGRFGQREGVPPES